MEAVLHDSLRFGGVAAITILMALERFIPLVPSYVLLGMIGAAAAAGLFGPFVALAASVAGSLLGAYLWFQIGRRIGAARVERAVARQGRWIALSPTRYAAAVASFRRRPATFLMTAQLIPTIRLIGSLPPGVLGMEWRAIVLPVLLGSLAWNGAFLGLGYGIGTAGLGPVETLIAVCGLLALEGLCLAVVVLRRRYRAAINGRRI